MIRHYFTLHRSVEEIKALIGCRLSSCFSQEKDSVILEFDDLESSKFISISVHPKYSSLLVRNQFARAKRNSVNVFNEVVGEYLQDIEIFENNRIIKFQFIKFTLYAYVFGGAKSKVVVVDKSSRISSALNCQDCKQGKKFRIEEHTVKSFSDFASDSKLYDALSKSELMLGRQYANEFLYKYEIDSGVLLSDLSSTEKADIYQNAQGFRADILAAEEILLYEKDGSILLSLIELKHLETAPKRTYDSLGNALAVRIGLSHSGDGYRPLYRKTTKILSRALSKVNKKIADIDKIDMIRENADKYQQYGELLLSQASTTQKDREKITLQNWSGEEITIKLNSKLTLVDNAQHYFKKAKNSKKDIAKRLESLPKHKKESKLLTDLFKELEQIENIKILDIFIKKLKLETGIRIKEEQMEAQDKFRTFDIGEGYTVYVGKNASNNDELTVKFAKPNDIWMHARGAAGSHAVLRGPDKDKKSPKYIIKAAASIAAYYSQARKAKLVPVAYTQKKYVRKPKGANTGSVTMSREDVVMVRPQLPEQD